MIKRAIKEKSKVMHGQYIWSILDSLLVKMTRTVEGRSESRDWKWYISSKKTHITHKTLWNKNITHETDMPTIWRESRTCPI